MTTLHGRASNNISLLDALGKCKTTLTDATAILYSPSFCRFAKFGNGRLTDEQTKEMDITTVFEARVFNPCSELRWLNVCNGEGRAVLISDNELTKIFEEDEDVSLQKILDTIPQQYLLWGKGVSAKSTGGWSRLAAARIGALDVPIPNIQPKQLVKLVAREYIGFCDGEAGKCGNVAVLEERLVCLEKVEVNP